MLGLCRRRVCLVDILLKSVTTPNKTNAASKNGQNKKALCKMLHWLN